MAQIHAIDGTNLTYIAQALWPQPSPSSLSLNLIQPYERWRDHIWLANVMTVTEWETLRGKRGSIVTITTTDPTAPNSDYITFYGVILKDLTNNSHDGPNILGVKVEFLVKV